MRKWAALFSLLWMAAALRPLAAEPGAVIAPHLHAQLLVPTQQIPRGGQAEAGIYFKLEPGWHIYWKNAGDAGEPPHARWTLPKGVTASPLAFPAPQRIPLGPLMDYGYEDEVLLPVVLKTDARAELGPMILRAKVDWLVCNESCLPGKADLELGREIVASTSAASFAPDEETLFRRLSERQPSRPPVTLRAGFKLIQGGFRLSFETPRAERSAYFYAEDPNLFNYVAPQRFARTAKGFTLDLVRDPNMSAPPQTLRGVLELGKGRAYAIRLTKGAPAVVAYAPTLADVEPPAPSGSALAQLLPGVKPALHAPLPLWRSAMLAFLGGLLLNLMPCVFPVLFLKAMALLRAGATERRELRRHGLYYALGVLASFWILAGLLLALRAAGARLGWGFQFQSPAFLALIASLLFFMALSLAGLFEVGVGWTGAGSRLAARQGGWGSFFTGVLAVIVATPCTAPFMGAALGMALAAPAVVALAVFTALALGLAAPYLVLSHAPAWTRWLPRPGRWMEILRRLVSLPLFATVVWLAWALWKAYGAGSLLALLAALALLTLSGGLLGRWPRQFRASTAAWTLIAAAAALCLLAPARLASAPPRPTATLVLDGWESWSPEAVSLHLSQGRPVFVDFTASWCLSCQVNERTALERPEVRAAFAQANVALLRADWTRRDPAITSALGALGRSGVPTYVLYSPSTGEAKLLPELLTPALVLESLQEFFPNRPNGHVAP